MSELTSRQRLATFMGRQSRNLFPIAESFVASWSRTFPAARGVVKLGSKTERFDFASTVAEFCKQAQAGHFDRTHTAGIGATLRRAGFTGNHAAARSAFLNACREHAGLDWTSEIERDLGEAADRFLNAMGVSAAESTPLRMAA